MARPTNARKVYYCLKFNLTTEKWFRALNSRLIEQLDKCPSDVEQRIILGKSR